MGARGLILGTILGTLLHLAVRYAIIKRPRYAITTRADYTVSPEIRETLILTAPKLIQYVMASAMLWTFTSIATNLGEGAVAANNYARNFQSVPVSLIGIAIASALFPSLSHDAGKGNFKKFSADFRSGLARTIVYTTLAGAGLAVLSKFVITTLLGGGKFTSENVTLLALTLQIYCLSVPLESLMHTYHRAYYALKNTLLPSAVHTIFMIASIAAAYLAAPKIGVLAIPACFAGGLLIHIAILAFLFPAQIRKAEKLL
jgi:putative peptidoglycan lipid II flippase